MASLLSWFRGLKLRLSMESEVESVDPSGLSLSKGSRLLSDCLLGLATLRKKECLRASWAELLQLGFQDNMAYKKETARADVRDPNTEDRWVGWKVGNRKFMALARPNPSDQSLRPGVPKTEATLYSWSISELPAIKNWINGQGHRAFFLLTF